MALSDDDGWIDALARRLWIGGGSRLFTEDELRQMIRDKVTEKQLEMFQQYEKERQREGQ